MLKVPVSIVPGGHGAERQLGHLLIKNVGGGSLNRLVGARPRAAVADHRANWDDSCLGPPDGRA